MHRRLHALTGALCLLAVVVAGLALAQPAHASSGPLAPESLLASAQLSTGPEYTLLELNCNPAGESSARFSVTGTATGTHEGTFSETVAVVFGPQVGGGPATITSLHADFRIDAADGSVITGAKELLPEDTDFSNLAACAAFDSPAPSAGPCPVLSILDVNAPVSYDATITSSGSSAYREQGYATLSAYGTEQSCDGERVTSSFFDEELLYGNDVTPVEPPVPTTVTLAPTTAVNTVGTQHSVTATVTDQNGRPVANVVVHFAVQGVSRSFADTCTTNVNGMCTFLYQGSELPGEDVITAYVDVNGNLRLDAGDPVATAAKTFVLPASTAGQATGGGALVNANGTGQLTFVFSAKSDANGVRGECALVDRASGTKIKCLEVLAYVQVGTTATFYGRATVDGVETVFRIQVTDRGEPGSGEDVFLLQTGLGYGAYGIVADGNVQVRA